MFAAVIRLATETDRKENPHAVLVPGGIGGVWICGALGFLVVLIGIILSFCPAGGIERAQLRVATGGRHVTLYPDWPGSVLAGGAFQKDGLILVKFNRVL